MSMKNNSLSERLAVCSWSLQPANPQDLIAILQAMKSAGALRAELEII